MSSKGLLGLASQVVGSGFRVYSSAFRFPALALDLLLIDRLQILGGLLRTLKIFPEETMASKVLTMGGGDGSLPCS